MTLSKAKLIIEDAIRYRKILYIVYKHTQDGETVDHMIAPFDIGTTNPQRIKQFAGNLYAYSYTHLNKDGLKDPRVCTFKIENIIELEDSGKVFDPIYLTDLNKKATKYDYRDCDFALVPERDWFP